MNEELTNACDQNSPLSLSAVVAIAYGAAALARKYLTAFASAPFAGLTAHRTEYVNCARDKLTPSAISTKRVLYMAPSGETAEVVEHVSSKDKSVIRFVNSGGLSMQIYESLQIYNAIRQGQFRPESTAKRLGDPRSECATRMDGKPNDAGQKIGEETLLSYRTIKFYRSNSAAGDQTTWLAPELGCFAIQAESVWGPGKDGLRSSTLQVTDQIQAGAPPPSAFLPTPGFTQVKPSVTVIESARARWRAEGVAESDIPQRLLAMQASEKERLDFFDSLSTK